MHWDSNRTSVNWIGLEDRGVSPLWRARLISWQLFVYHVTTISPDEEDAQFHRLRIEQRRSLSKNDDFGWQDQTRRWYVGRIWMRNTSRISRMELKRSHSESRGGLTPSHSKPQLPPLTISPVGVHEPSATAAPSITIQDRDRPTKGFK